MNIKYKEISKQRYRNRVSLLKKKHGVAWPLFSNVSKSMKLDFINKHIPPGSGLLEHARSHSKLDELASEDDYTYYIEDGYEFYIYCGEEMYKALEETEDKTKPFS